MARLFAWVLPSLEFFNAGPAISTGAVIPWVGYVFLHSAIACCTVEQRLFAFLLFEDRDLA